MLVYLPTLGSFVLLGIPVAIIIAIWKSAYDAYLTRLNKQRREKFEQQLQEFMEQDPKYRAARDELERLKKERERVSEAIDPHDELYELHRSELYALYDALDKAMDHYHVRRRILLDEFLENQKTS